MKSGSRFESCYLALLAALWDELESILAAGAVAAPATDGRADCVALRAQALLLELVILCDRCESDSWRALMGLARAERVSRTVSALHATLQDALPGLGTRGCAEAIERAQDELFDEAYRLASGAEPYAGPLVRRWA
jgi:hypothetical protein